MATYTIEPERRTLHGKFSRDFPPVLTIYSGDTVVYRTLDAGWNRSEEHTSELQSQSNLVCRLLLEKKNDPHMPNVSRPGGCIWTHGDHLHRPDSGTPRVHVRGRPRPSGPARAAPQPGSAVRATRAH